MPKYILHPLYHPAEYEISQEVADTMMWLLREANKGTDIEKSLDPPKPRGKRRPRRRGRRRGRRP